LRTILVLPAIFCILGGSAAAEAPFAPLTSQPDYVVTMTESSYRKTVAALTVTHHESWTRIDRVQGSNPSTGYFFANGLATVRIYGQGSVVSFLLGRVPNYSGADLVPRKTEERQIRLGEGCTVWDVWRTKRERTGYSLTHSSCVTDDGIELWQKSVNDNDTISAAEATQVERRPVALEEVKPSLALLKLDWWDQGGSAPAALVTPDHETDHETVMELTSVPHDTEKSVRITRRLGPWQSQDETVNGIRRRFEITHDSHVLRFDYASNESGAPKELTIMRLNSAPSDPATPTLEQSTFTQPKDMNRFETVLGETCRWFDMTPGIADAGHSACMSSDGIVLKDHRYARSRERTWTAVRVTRRPVSLDEIKPPAELLEPQTWGIE